MHMNRKYGFNLIGLPKQYSSHDPVPLIETEKSLINGVTNQSTHQKWGVYHKEKHIYTLF